MDLSLERNFLGRLWGATVRPSGEKVKFKFE